MPEQEPDGDTSREISLLKAELTLLRANMKKMEKENDILRDEKRRFVLDKFELEQELKKKITLQLKEDKIAENQKKMLKANTICTKDSDEISSRFILWQAINCSDFNSDDSLQKFKFFRDYFFDDFFSIPDDNALKVVEHYFKHHTRLFFEAYALFSCKKSVFQQFSQYIFENNSFVQQKVEILECVPPEWTLDLLETSLKRFLVLNKKRLLHFIRNIAEKCPSYLIKVFSKQDFNDVLLHESPIGYKIISSIATQKISGLVDETNLHLVPKPFLEILFDDQYIDIIS
ncbi:uncharacterized protein VICG_01281 [Vittaforma corneae ATCC 50505]|uniref:Uncharacterized protein n=1 Tax=Vittaforma corneae (strain ATCC 50505) TaxID=993615 RepID=L2GL99_VITCO|nr:uncharacterized protein VICG_01281 [Vittaforma corneae ATCC 50505]ELA41648.1 hypothetical protein VICG_01281 [Vittaforma corneae ATCC 50505]